MEKYNWNYPTTMWVGEKRINDLSLACKNLNITKPLIVTDNNLSKSYIIKNILSNLKNNNFFVELFSFVCFYPGSDFLRRIKTAPDSKHTLFSYQHFDRVPYKWHRSMRRIQALFEIQETLWKMWTRS